MQLAVYADGRALRYDESTQQFFVGEAQVTREQVAGYDAAGQLTWDTPELQQWFHGSVGKAPAATSATPKKRNKTLVVVLVAVALIGLCGLISNLGGNGGSGSDSSKQSATVPGRSPAQTTTGSDQEATEPPPPAPAPKTAAPTPVQKPAPATKPAPKPVKKDYKSMSSRDFAKLCKDPDSHTGKTCLIYGEVTQFDSATGTDQFRANVGEDKLTPEYGFVDYSQNSMLSGSDAMFKDVVQGDLFTAKVTVLGSFSYDTQIGGNTTVPAFHVDQIKVYDHLD